MMALNVLKVWSPGTLDAVLAGPGSSNRLFIFTGIAEIDWLAPRDNKLAHASVELVLSDWHGDIHLDLQATQLASVAWPTSMHGDDDADQVTWAVDAAYAFVSAAQRPTLHMELSVQGDKGMLGRIGYQVFARTTSIPIKSFDVTQDIFLPELVVSVVLSQVAVGSGEDIYLTSLDSRVKLPTKVTVPAGSDTLTTGVSLNLGLFPLGDTQVVFKARNAVSEKDTTTIIHRES
jgi:hypothetical protein